MSGIFPNSADGAVDPNETVHGYTPTNAPTGTVTKYFPQDCNTKIRPETVNSIISEIACVIDKSGLAYSSSSNCNLLEAIKNIILTSTLAVVATVVRATCQTTAPSGLAIGDFWLDTDANPLTLSRWSGTAFINVPVSTGPNLIVCEDCATATTYINCSTAYKLLTP